jgi:hypothetical protein
MNGLSKTQFLNSCFTYLGDFEAGFEVTLNAINKDKIKFDAQLRLFADWLNDYCYGRQFKNKKRLKMIAGIEFGDCNGGLHAHIVIKHDQDMKRSLQEINAVVRKNWGKLIGVKCGLVNNLVNVQPIRNNESFVIYSLKDSNKYDEHHLTYSFL